ncbi:hypothetical protein [Lysinibacillus telephonicus]|uniref:hypothetical protein n=1 Tax=Lysinibacillus telephonicus TaxID=1714840 RepID=UPI003B9EC06A
MDRDTINLKDGVYIIQNGEVVDTLQPKKYGQDIIQWQHGVVFEVSESHKRRVKKSNS